MTQDVYDKMSVAEWFYFWCATYDFRDEPEYESNICYYIKSTNSIWDGEEFITNVPAELASYIMVYFPACNKRKTKFRIGVSYELTRVIQIEFSRKAIITRILKDM